MADEGQTNGTGAETQKTVRTILDDAKRVVLALSDITDDCRSSMDPHSDLAKQDLEDRVHALIEESKQRLKSLTTLTSHHNDFITGLVTTIRTAAGTTSTNSAIEINEAALYSELAALLNSFTTLTQSHQRFITTLLKKIRTAAGSANANAQTEKRANTDVSDQTESKASTETNDQNNDQTNDQTGSKAITETLDQTESKDNEITVTSELDALLASHSRFIATLLNTIRTAANTSGDKASVPGTQDAVATELAKLLEGWTNLWNIYQESRNTLTRADPSFTSDMTLPVGISNLAADRDYKDGVISAQNSRIELLERRIMELEQQVADLTQRLAAQTDKPKPAPPEENKTSRRAWKTRPTWHDDGASVAGLFGFAAREIWELNNDHITAQEWKLNHVQNSKTVIYLPDDPMREKNRPQRTYMTRSQDIGPTNSIEDIARWFWVNVEDILPKDVPRGKRLNDVTLTIPAADKDAKEWMQ